MALTLSGRGLVAIHGHWGKSRVSQAAQMSRHSSQFGAGLRALGPRGSSGGVEGSRTRWTPVMAGPPVFAGRCVPVPALRAQEGGGGARVLPRTGGRG